MAFRAAIARLRSMRHILPLVALLLATSAHADPARIVAITATEASGGWRFDVTVEHGDTGWDDYADGWRVELADGTVLGERPLAHPHVDEQPFTRSTSGVQIGHGVSQVFLRTRTNVEGWADSTAAYDLPR